MKRNHNIKNQSQDNKYREDNFKEHIILKIRLHKLNLLSIHNQH